MCAAISQHSVIHHHATLDPYNTAHLTAFLDILHNILIPPDQIDGPVLLRVLCYTAPDMLFMAGFAMQRDISSAAWPGKTLLVTWMRCCGQIPTDERMQQSLFVFCCYHMYSTLQFLYMLFV
ncbi:hypothetical protein AMECASPLE_013717 [Ameca splendens]|uniref:Uncharacterized protein n=1 Tax=Ameca splendens TaxID=208324 RepID=A0ABV0Y1F3_9TELE